MKDCVALKTFKLSENGIACRVVAKGEALKLPNEVFASLSSEGYVAARGVRSIGSEAKAMRGAPHNKALGPAPENKALL